MVMIFAYKESNVTIPYGSVFALHIVTIQYGYKDHGIALGQLWFFCVVRQVVLYCIGKESCEKGS